ncbi:MAG: non-canonical purine NTP pyrophosphatase [Burkholderiaceae bacterium]|nr:non-canonical purine NTP pyrophosphatase [Burkholderiaceae bacterium]
MSRRRIVLASGNAGKLREFSALFGAAAAVAPGRAPVDIVPQGDLGIGAADEPHSTFVENALAKARHAASSAGLPALADDSGLCVDALGGGPGVLSARFAGEPADDERNNMELLRRLAGVTQRAAHYVCVLVALRTADDPEPLIADARWYGEIRQAPRGQGGFGYDALFDVAGLGVTAAELDPDHKNRISHRALALASLAPKLAEWRW